MSEDIILHLEIGLNIQQLSEESLLKLRYNTAAQLVLPASFKIEENSAVRLETGIEIAPEGLRKLTNKEISHVRWAFYYLKMYEPEETADNLEQVSHYLEAFYHLCELETWEEAWKVLFIHLDTPTREELHIQLGTWGYYQQQIELYNRLLGKLDSKFDGICYIGLGNAYCSQGDYDHAIEYYQKRLAIANEIEDCAGISAAFGGLGIAYQLQGEYSRAIEYLEKHLAIATEINDRAGISAALGNLGNVYQFQGEYSRAIEYVEKHLAIATEINDRAGISAALGNLGNVYQSQGEYTYAIQYYEQDLLIAKEIGNCIGIGTALGNLGNAYDSQGNHIRAIDYHQKHLAIAKEIGDRAGIGRAFCGLGVAYYSQGDYTCAIDYHEQSLAMATDIGDHRLEAIILFNLGSALARVDQKWKAIAAYENARNLYQAMGITQDVEKCNHAIRDIGMKVVVEPQRYLELPSTPARRKCRKFSRKWQQLKADIGKSFSIFFRLVSRWVRSVFRK